jgi:putative ABC transport system permease protein
VSTSSRTLLRAAAFAVDRALPLNNLQLLDDYIASEDIEYKSLGPAFSAIAVITVILAATGLFGLISRSVARRTHEVGIRRALGSTPWQVIHLFLRQGALYFCVGLVGGGLGVIITDVLDNTIGTILEHVVAVTFGVFVIIALVIFFASYLPSRRAVSLEPSEALRYE